MSFMESQTLSDCSLAGRDFLSAPLNLLTLGKIEDIVSFLEYKFGHISAFARSFFEQRRRFGPFETDSYLLKRQTALCLTSLKPLYDKQD